LVKVRCGDKFVAVRTENRDRVRSLDEEEPRWTNDVHSTNDPAEDMRTSLVLCRT
jgi:hypothetical protein